MATEHRSRETGKAMKFLMLWILGFLPLTLAMAYNVSDEEELEIANLLKKLNRPYVKSIKSPSGDIIDCVPFHLQSAFDDPLNKNVTYESLQRRSRPKGFSGNSSSDIKPLNQLWHTKGRCPERTVPIIRLTREYILRSRSAEKSRIRILRTYRNPGPPPNVTNNVLHEYAIRKARGRFLGTRVDMGIWNPRVQGRGEFSLAQVWLYSGEGHVDLNTIEAGWQVYPRKYGDSQTRLFGFFTKDNYRTPCYNLDCPNTFVQFSNAITLGGVISPISVYGTIQHMLSMFVYKDAIDGHWWLEVGGDAVGYWPSHVFTRLAQGSATGADWGGEVVNNGVHGVHTETQMGSGSFSTESDVKAAAFSKLQIVNEASSLGMPMMLSTHVTYSRCYDLTDRTTRDGLGFSYGGPGKNRYCP